LLLNQDERAANAPRDREYPDEAVACHLTGRFGGSETNPSVKRMREVLAELDSYSDAEHSDAWLSDESGWTLSVGQDGRLVWENVDADGPVRHLSGVPRERALALWIALSEGRIADVEAQPWRDGHGRSPPTAGEEAIVAAALLAWQREFVDRLGDERADERCGHPGCERGAVPFSTLCRRHHFESVMKRPYPF
jgi:hypothetical protein